jgi:hypothetical protein
MANFEIQIAEDRFQSLGVKVVFDENLYSGLLDQALLSSDVLAASKVPTVHLTPNPLWGMGIIRRAVFMLADKEAAVKMGNYNYEDTIINIFCMPNERHANTALRHETKHWADDNAGTLEYAYQQMGKKVGKLLGGAVLLGAGVTIASGEFIDSQTVQPIVGIASVIGASTVPILCYSRAPHEVAARKFADDKDVIREYGDIIRYKQL